jgi:hypothetical protein
MGLTESKLTLDRNFMHFSNVQLGTEVEKSQISVACLSTESHVPLRGGTESTEGGSWGPKTTRQRQQ